MLASLHLLTAPAGAPGPEPLALAAARPEVAPPAGRGEGIEQLAFLVGGVWVAGWDVADPTATIEERCTWGLAGHFIFTEVTQRRGAAVLGTARGAFGYDPAAAVLRSWSFSSAGTFQSAVQTGGSAAPPSWVFLSTLQGTQQGQSQVTMSHEAADVMTVAQQAAGGPAVRLVYRRRGD